MLLEVNGRNFETLSHEEAVNVLKDLPDGIVSMVIRRRVTRRQTFNPQLMRKENRVRDTLTMPAQVSDRPLGNGTPTLSSSSTSISTPPQARAPLIGSGTGGNTATATAVNSASTASTSQPPAAKAPADPVSSPAIQVTVSGARPVKTLVSSVVDDGDEELADDSDSDNDLAGNSATDSVA